MDDFAGPDLTPSTAELKDLPGLTKLSSTTPLFLLSTYFYF
jgi:hypothetical protein